VSFYETVGFGYTILATVVFTVQVIYCAIKGLGVIRHYIERGRGGPDRRAANTSSVETSKRPVIKITS
jgi:hypothetical protein